MQTVSITASQLFQKYIYPVTGGVNITPAAHELWKQAMAVIQNCEIIHAEWVQIGKTQSPQSPVDTPRINIVTYNVSGDVVAKLLNIAEQMKPHYPVA